MVLRRLLRITIFIAALALACFVTRNLWLAGMGWALVHNDGPAKAELAVVLAGDYTGERLRTAAELVRQGYVPRVLVSGPPGFYGVNEADAAIRFAVANGYPAEWFLAMRHRGFSTREEVAALMGYLKAQQVHRILLVTSDFHTARSRRLFLAEERRVGGGPDVRVVAAPDYSFASGQWWHTREGQKTVFLEWTKTVTGAFGI